MELTLKKGGAIQVTEKQEVTATTGGGYGARNGSSSPVFCHIDDE